MKLFCACCWSHASNGKRHFVKMDRKTNTKCVVKPTVQTTMKMSLLLFTKQTNSMACYVALCEKYLLKLNPKHIYSNLLRWPLNSFTENSQIWFYHVPVGRDILTKFNKRSQIFSISQIYTNHSIRAAGTTI